LPAIKRTLCKTPSLAEGFLCLFSPLARYARSLSAAAAAKLAVDTGTAKDILWKQAEKREKLA